MKTTALKRIAADILNVGVNRIRIKDFEEHSSRIAEALTREDVKALIKDKIVYAVPVKPKKRKERKRKSAGRRKGTKYSRKPKKEIWMERIRALRRFLNKLVEEGKVARENKRKLYLKIKGGHFRGKSAFLTYLKDNGFLVEVSKNE